MAVSAHLRFIYFIYLIAVLCVAQISDLRLCANLECSVAISEARTLIRYHSNDPQILSFPINARVKVLSKSAGTNEALWGAEISGRRGYVPKKFIREEKVLIPASQLKFIVPTTKREDSSDNVSLGEDSAENISSNSVDETKLISSWVKSAAILTDGLESIATFTKEFPASLNKLTTDFLLKGIFTSAQAISSATDEKKILETVKPTVDSSTIDRDNVVFDLNETNSVVTSSMSSINNDDDDILSRVDQISPSPTTPIESTATVLANDATTQVLDKKVKRDFFVCNVNWLTSCEYSFGVVMVKRRYEDFLSEMNDEEDDIEVDDDGEEEEEDDLDDSSETEFLHATATEMPTEVPTEVPAEVPTEEVPAEVPTEEVPAEVLTEEVPAEIPNEVPTEMPSNIINTVKQHSHMEIENEIITSDSSQENFLTTENVDVVTQLAENLIDEMNTLEEIIKSNDSISENVELVTQIPENIIEEMNALESNDSITEFVNELRNFVQFIIDFLPEFVRVILDEQMEKGVSPRVTVFTIITASFLALFLAMYFIIKRGSKESALIARLCELDRQMFALTTERDVLKEQCDHSSESVQDFHDKYGKSEELVNSINLQLVALKDENVSQKLQINDLEQQLNETQTVNAHLNSQVENQNLIINKLKDEIEVKTEKGKQLEEKITNLEQEMNRKLETISDDQQQIGTLSGEISHLQQDNSQLLQEAQVWNERVEEMQQQIEILSDTTQELQTQLATKDKEIEVLRVTLEEVDVLKTDEDSNSKLSKLEKMLDVSAISIELKANLIKMDNLQEEYNCKLKVCLAIENEIAQIKSENELLKQRDLNLQHERDEAVTKLQVLSDYFKEKEIELQKELGVQEAMRQQTVESALSVTEKAELYEKEVQLHRSHIEALKKEMETQLRSYKAQIALHESKSHENWLAARTAERKAEEAKQEAAVLRNKLTIIEHEKETLNRIASEEMRNTPNRRYTDSNGQIGSPKFDSESITPPCLDRRLPFLPLDRPIPPPPLGIPLPPPPVPLGPPPPPPHFAPHPSRSLFDIPPPMIPFDNRFRDFRPPPFHRRPPPPPPPPTRYNNDSRDLSPPRFQERTNFSAPLRFASPHSKASNSPMLSDQTKNLSPYLTRKNGSPPSDATSV